ncbi:hypothetical protein HELRODRAFT_175851 [Helobdella robusta]|uniref:Uncharacterized protein n=1 Tax=Helobdella robusta TaxID=6412 RepID=T1F9S0_HELRO|nr:hypothetical protein HELRODRAFT_175851 [Helobdella robusta]ESO00428.1 hypothetical protein HELRODRAFT_175851 [Helobdella robusta]
MAVYPSVEEMKMVELIVFILNTENAVRWAKQHGLIAAPMTCRCLADIRFTYFSVAALNVGNTLPDRWPGHIVQIDESCISPAKRLKNQNARPKGSAGEQDMEIYEKRKGHGQLDEQHS